MIFKWKYLLKVDNRNLFNTIMFKTTYYVWDFNISNFLSGNSSETSLSMNYRLNHQHFAC